MFTSNAQSWYAALEKPWFAPPDWLFGPVWRVLYVIIAVSFGYVMLQVFLRRWPVKVIFPFLINLAANAAFSPLQFALQNNVLALVDILIVLGTIPWMMAVVWHRRRWVAWAQVPYLLWVSFATILQATITWLNW